MNQDDLYEFFFRNREFKMFNEIIEITWNQTDFNEIKWFRNLVQDFWSKFVKGSENSAPSYN